MAATPFLSKEADVRRKCLLCNENINDKEDISNVTIAGIQSLQALAERWQSVDTSLCSQPPYTEFQLAAPKLFIHHNDMFIHNRCRITFRNRLKRKESQSSKLKQSDSEAVAGSSGTDSKTHRIVRGSAEKKRVCFICNVETSNDSKQFNNGGLGRCSEENAFNKIKSQMDLKINDEENKYHAAAMRLDVLLSGACYDVFALDLFYHKTCYINFTYAYDKNKPTADDIEKEELGSKVIGNFFRLFHRKVIKDQEAFLLTELLQDLKEMGEDYELDKAPITKTFTLKQKLIEKFGDSIDFNVIGRRLIVYSSKVNPLTYTSATIQGHGLREDDLTKAFSRLIRRKISQREPMKWPLDAQELLDHLDAHKPLRCIYNTISWSIDPKRTKNDFGYAAAPSKIQGEIISAISQSWEKMTTGDQSPLAVAMSLTIHRLTGSKEATTLLHRCGVGIPYTDVRHLNNEWAKSVTMEHKKMLPPGFIKGRSVHITFDNSDGKEQTMTGTHTTHHTTGTIFQARYPYDDINTTVPKPDQTDIIDQENADYGSFKIPIKRAQPPSFPMFKDDYKDSPLLDGALERNIAWVLTGTVDDSHLEECCPDIQTPGPFGSWTAFMKGVTNCSTTKCKLEYLPVIPLPPGDNVVKWYMDMIVQIASDLELDYIFAHADEAINCKMLIISWINQERYDKIIPIMGGFHTILVKLKILFKRYGCLGFNDWWVDAGAIADGSVVQSFEGRHYYRSVRLHKQLFEALIRYRMKASNVITKLEPQMKETISKLRQHPSSENLKSLLSMPGFKSICSAMMSADGTQAKMMVEYLKDVSAMLCLIAAVRGKNIELHLAAERSLLPRCFAFGHVNYARYLTFQHVNLQHVKLNKKEAWEDLVKNGFGGSLSGEPFSTIHGDMITETTINREVKVRGGPMKGGYSTNERTTDAFIKTSHIMAKIRTALKERLNVLTSSAHKETTMGARKQHDNIVQDLVIQLDKYFDPFLNGAARHFKTGVEIDCAVVTGLLSSVEAGEKKYKEFVDFRLKAIGEERVNFFDKITKLKIATGMEKTKKNPKAVNILKEDRQAFGVMVGKTISPKESHSYPLTTVPLALATPGSDLRQSSKAALRNYLIEESMSIHDEPPKGGNWIIDGMAAVKSVPAKQSWGEYAAALLNFCLPSSHSKAQRVGIIFDSYSGSTIKDLTQRRRGTPGRRTHITSPEQSMPKGKDWDSFLRNPENKTELIRFLIGYYKNNAVRSKLTIPLTVTEEENTWLITQLNTEKLDSCNHIEADTRLILQASKSKDPVIVRATDTDVLILLIYAYSVCKPLQVWLMQIGRERYINVKAIADRFGDEICQVLPAFHSITGCDTTSFPFGIGKVKPLKKMEKLGKCALLSHLGTSLNSVKDIADAKCFFRTCMYAGSENEEFVETRIKMYNKQKIKSSSSILPDESSTDEHLKRSDLQSYIWHQCLKQDIEYPSIKDRGWKETEDGIRPVWFSCSQFPPSLCVTNSRTRQMAGDVDYDADSEETREVNQPPTKKRRTMPSHCGSKGSERLADDGSDSDSIEDQSSASLDNSKDLQSSDCQSDMDSNLDIID